MEEETYNQKLNAIQAAYVPLLTKYLDEVQEETPIQKKLKTLHTLLTSKSKRLGITTLNKSETILIKIFGQKLKPFPEPIINVFTKESELKLNNNNNKSVIKLLCDNLIQSDLLDDENVLSDSEIYQSSDITSTQREETTDSFSSDSVLKIAHIKSQSCTVTDKMAGKYLYRKMTDWLIPTPPKNKDPADDDQLSPALNKDQDKPSAINLTKKYEKERNVNEKSVTTIRNSPNNFKQKFKSTIPNKSTNNSNKPRRNNPVPKKLPKIFRKDKKEKPDIKASNEIANNGIASKALTSILLTGKEIPQIIEDKEILEKGENKEAETDNTKISVQNVSLDRLKPAKNGLKLCCDNVDDVSVDSFINEEDYEDTESSLILKEIEQLLARNTDSIQTAKSDDRISNGEAINVVDEKETVANENVSETVETTEIEKSDEEIVKNVNEVEVGETEAQENVSEPVETTEEEIEKNRNVVEAEETEINTVVSVPVATTEIGKSDEEIQKSVNVEETEVNTNVRAPVETTEIGKCDEEIQKKNVNEFILSEGTVSVDAVTVEELILLNNDTEETEVNTVVRLVSVPVATTKIGKSDEEIEKNVNEVEVGETEAKESKENVSEPVETTEEEMEKNRNVVEAEETEVNTVASVATTEIGNSDEEIQKSVNVEETEFNTNAIQKRVNVEETEVNTNASEPVETSEIGKGDEEIQMKNVNESILSEGTVAVEEAKENATEPVETTEEEMEKNRNVVEAEETEINTVVSVPVATEIGKSDEEIQTSVNVEETEVTTNVSEPVETTEIGKCDEEIQKKNVNEFILSEGTVSVDAVTVEEPILLNNDTINVTYPVTADKENAHELSLSSDKKLTAQQATCISKPKCSRIKLKLSPVKPDDSLEISNSSQTDSDKLIFVIEEDLVTSIPETVDLTTVELIPGILDLTLEDDSLEFLDLTVSKSKSHPGIIDLTDPTELSQDMETTIPVQTGPKDMNDFSNLLDGCLRKATEVMKFGDIGRKDVASTCTIGEFEDNSVITNEINNSESIVSLPLIKCISTELLKEKPIEATKTSPSLLPDIVWKELDLLENEVMKSADIVRKDSTIEETGHNSMITNELNNTELIVSLPLIKYISTELLKEKPLEATKASPLHKTTLFEKVLDTTTNQTIVPGFGASSRPSLLPDNVWKELDLLDPPSKVGLIKIRRLSGDQLSNQEIETTVTNSTISHQPVELPISTDTRIDEPILRQPYKMPRLKYTHSKYQNYQNQNEDPRMTVNGTNQTQIGTKKSPKLQKQNVTETPILVPHPGPVIPITVTPTVISKSKITSQHNEIVGPTVISVPIPSIVSSTSTSQNTVIVGPHKVYVPEVNETVQKTPIINQSLPCNVIQTVFSVPMPSNQNSEIITPFRNKPPDQNVYLVTTSDDKLIVSKSPLDLQTTSISGSKNYKIAAQITMFSSNDENSTVLSKPTNTTSGTNILVEQNKNPTISKQNKKVLPVETMLEIHHEQPVVTISIEKILPAVTSISTQQRSMPLIDEISTPIPPPSTNHISRSVAGVKIEGNHITETPYTPLRPWIALSSDKTHMSNTKMMMNKKIFNCLYKCMEFNCATISDDSTEFLAHIKQHERCGEEKLFMGEPSMDIDSWLTCCYCDTIADTCNLLLEHINAVHSTSIFQCNNCFYRSSTAYNVITHYKQHHDDKDVLINVASSPPQPLAIETSFLINYRKKFVKGITCEEHHLKFYVLQDFVDHLEKTHTDSQYTCHLCSDPPRSTVTLPVRMVTKHLLCHKIGIFACIFCSFGTNCETLMRNHMSNNHSTKPLFACARFLGKDAQVASSKVEATILVNLEDIVPTTVFTNYTTQLLKPDYIYDNSVNFLSFDQLRDLYLCPKIDNVIKTEATLDIVGVLNKSLTKDDVVVEPQPDIKPTIEKEQITKSVTTVVMKLSKVSKPSESPKTDVKTTKKDVTPKEASKLMETQTRIVEVSKAVKSSKSEKPIEVSKSSKSSKSSKRFKSVVDVGPVSNTSKSSKSKPQPTEASRSSKRSNISPLSDVFPVIDVKESRRSKFTPQPEERAHNPTEPSRSTKRCKISPLADDCPIIDETATVSKRPKITPTQPEEVPVIKDEPEPVPAKKKNQQEEIDIFVTELIKKTGLEKRDLYRCNFCDESFDERRLFQFHCLKCVVEKNEQIKCFHCDTKPKTVIDLIKHIKYHQPKRFLCYFCDENAVGLASMIIHTERKHSKNVKAFPLNPSKSNKDCDIFVIAPKIKSELDIYEYGLRLMEKKQKIQEKTSFQPNESCDLPKSLWFNTELSCAVCRFSTKIRSELVQHLQKHVTTKLTTHVDQDSKKLIPTKSVTSPVQDIKKTTTPKLIITPVQDIKKLRSLPGASKLVPIIPVQDIKKTKTPKLVITPVQDIGKLRSLPGASKSAPISPVQDKKNTTIKPQTPKLATSSVQVTKKHTTKSSKQDSKKLRSFPDTPKFIDEKLRYSCGAKSCSYNTKVTSLLKTHLIKHKAIYKCPHCNKDPLFHSSTESYLDHLELHGSTLYKCLHCKFYHNLKSSCLKHITEAKHDYDSINILTIRETSNIVSISEITPTTSKVTENTTTTKIVDNVLISTSHRFVFSCFHCMQSYPTIDELKKHWNTLHKMPKFKKGVPFQFKITKMICCYYCDKKGGLTDIQKHSRTDHSGKPFLTVDYKEKKKCSECNYTISDKSEFTDHFQKNHPTINFLNQTLLDSLLNLNNTKTYKCEYCEFWCDTKNEIKKHCVDSHPKENVTAKKCKDQLRYSCSHIVQKKSCNEIFNDEFDAIKHIRNHSKFFGCNFCDKKYIIKNMVEDHQKAAHQKQGAVYPSSCVNRVVDYVIAMNVLFPNGLICTKEELAHTVYGEMAEITKRLHFLNDMDKQEVVDKNVAKKLDKKLNSLPLKRTSERNRDLPESSSSSDISTSDDDDLDPKFRYPKKTVERKRVLAVSSSSSSSDDDDDFVFAPRRSRKRLRVEDSSDSDDVDDDKKLEKFPGEYSFYGLKKETVDFSKIYYVMNNSMRMSCDKLVLYFDMQPSLKICKLKK